MIRSFFLIFVLSVLASCANGARTDAIAARPRDALNNPINITLKNAIMVTNVQGGSGQLESFGITDGEFKEATEKALKNYGYLAEPANSAQYKLDVNIKKIDLDSHFVSQDKEVTANIDYKITSISNGSIYFDKTFETKFNAEGMGLGKTFFVHVLLGPGAADSNTGTAYVTAFNMNLNKFLDTLGQQGGYASSSYTSPVYASPYSPPAYASSPPAQPAYMPSYQAQRASQPSAAMINSAPVRH